MITPTVGRIVWYYEGKHRGDMQGSGSGAPMAALVVKVHSDRLVNLAIFDATGQHHARTSIPLLQDDDLLPGAGNYCRWMPYQVQKAKAGYPNSESAEPRPK